MADYAPPSLDDLWALVGRDLTDPDHKVFNTSQLTDYINGGIAELNRARPMERVVTRAWDDDTNTVILTGLPLTNLFHVELRSLTGDRAQFAIPSAKTGGSSIRNGWEYFGRQLFLGPRWATVVLDRLSSADWNLYLWGYMDRDPLVNDDDIAEFDELTEEMFVRLYSRMEAYRSLNIDRGLFQQWQMQANNSDVSPTQLNGMLGTAESSFDRQQKRLYLPRRIPSV